MDKIIRVAQRPIHARLNIPGSKSITNRALLLAALANGVSNISELLLSDDTFAMVTALNQLGVIVQLNKEARSCVIVGSGGKFPCLKTPIEIACRDSGTVARFLLAACSASPGTYHFSGSAQLCQRPMGDLLDVLSLLGVQRVPKNSKKLPLTLISKGAINGGEISIDTSKTGQFLSALLMIAPLAKKPLMIQAKDNIVSDSYVNMTCQMMAEFGVAVQRIDQSYFSVPAPQQYQARLYTIEPDFSTASYFFAAAAVTGGQVTIPSLTMEQSKQGDAAFLKVLEKMGCHIIQNTHGLTIVGASQLTGITANMCDFSDTFMTLAAIAPFASTPTTITHIGHTRYKECNRITVIHEELEKLQVKVESGIDWLKIYPSKPYGTVIDSHQDHRIAMAFSVMGLRVPGIVINGAECVNKTCPDFFKLWDALYSSVPYSQ